MKQNASEAVLWLGLLAEFGASSSLARCARFAAAVWVSVFVLLVGKAEGAPANDNFAAREVLAGFTNIVSTSNVGATKEVGEPDHHGVAGGVSVWWSWTAPTNASVTVDTIGSSLDSVLAVYTGTTLAGLTLVGSDDDSGGSGTSKLIFNGVAGTTYQFAVDGLGGFAGDITFRLIQTPPVPPWLVTTNADNGPGSLRQALNYANTNAGTDTIVFAIPGNGPHTILLRSPLPELLEPVVVDGTSQPGYAGVPKIIIHGDYSHGPLLKISAGFSTVRGLALHGAGTDNGSVGDGIQLSGAGSNVVTACYFGLDPGGVSRVGNIANGLRILDSRNNTIGGLLPAERNRFADSLLITGGGASNNVVRGNVFGLQADGATSAGAGRVTVADAPNNVLGGTVPAARNIFQAGVTLTGTASGNVVQGNYIGTTEAGGVLADANTRVTDGVALEASGNQLLGNVISGCAQRGVYFDSFFSPSSNVIQGNLIGTDPTGTQPVPNDVGIEVYGDNNLIGGTQVGERNLIAGNVNHGLWLYRGQSNRVYGNFFGTTLTGQARLPGTATTNGLYFTATGQGNLIGGLAPGERNLFSGAQLNGAHFNDSATRGSFVGNWLGLAADGTTLLGNTERGLRVAETVGGNYFASNVVAGHTVEGIFVGRVQGTGTATNLFLANTVRDNPGIGINLFSPTRNVVRQNSLYGNGGLAIDVFGNGPSFLATGAEYNYPILTNVQIVGETLLIEGYLRAPLGTYTIEFFANDAGDNPPQARTYLGETTVVISQVTAQSVVGTSAPFRTQTRVAQSRDPQSNSNGTEKAQGQTPRNGTKPGDNVVGRNAGGEISGPQPAVGGSAGSPTAGANLNSGSTGDPINTFTGELFDTMPADLDLGGPLPLRFQRYYASGLKKTGVAGPLGDNWRHNFEWSLATTASNTVRILNPEGRLIEFTNTGSAFVLLGRQDIRWQLASSGGNFTLGDPRSQLLHTFSSTGQLVQIASPRGPVHQLTYVSGQLASVSDGLGRTLTFSYSLSGALTNLSDGTRNVGFTQAGTLLTAVVNPLGFTTAYAYDLANTNSGLLTAWTNPVGTVPFVQRYDAQGRVTNQTDGGQFTTVLAYNGLNTTVTDPRGNARVHIHDAEGNLLTSRDEASLSLSLAYNPAGQRSAVTDRLGDTIGIGYHTASGLPAAITNADGTFTTFTYAARTVSGIVFYDLVQTVFPDGTTEQVTYDANGNVLSRVDRAGRTWSFTYNARGQVLTAVNPVGGITTRTYDSAGRLATRADSDTGTTTFTYDQFDRLTNVTHPDGAFQRMVWDANDRLVASTDERGNTTTFTYDANNNLRTVTDALGRVSSFAYDARDRMVRATNRLGQVASRAYGPLDQLVAVTNRNGHVTTFNYDARRRLVASVDPAGRPWSTGYDAEDIPVSQTNPLGETVTTGTDRLGYAVSTTNALGHVNRLVRDALRRVTATVDGLGRTNTFGYDARGLLASAGKPVIGTATYGRNALGVLTNISDLNGSQWRFAHTPMGRESGRTDPLNRAQTMTYDSRGRPLRTVFPDGVTCTNFYDPAGNLVRRAYSDGTDYPFTYDALNRMTAANGLAFAYDAEGRLTNTASSGVNYGTTYDAGGRLTSVSYHNGAFTVNYAYDSRDRVIAVSDTLTGTTLGLDYDDAGRLISITRPNGVNGSYNYDAAGRLTRIREGTILDLQFTFDAAQQLTGVNYTAPLDPARLHVPNAQTHTYDAAHQITTPGFAWDARGRQTASPGHAFQWDGASSLRQIDGVTLTYDGMNNLQTRTAAGVTTRYFYHQAISLAPILAERNETAAQMLRYYVWTPGGRLLYAIDAANGNAVSHYHFDQVGSTLALTAANGTVTDAYAYTPYGVLLGRIGTSPQPFTYVGAYGVRDEPAANLCHMRARYYHASSSRFLSKDCVHPRLKQPTTLTTYDYAARNPKSYIDPLGEEENYLAGWEARHRLSLNRFLKDKEINATEGDDFYLREDKGNGNTGFVNSDEQVVDILLAKEGTVEQLVQILMKRKAIDLMFRFNERNMSDISNLDRWGTSETLNGINWASLRRGVVCSLPELVRNYHELKKKK